MVRKAIVEKSLLNNELRRTQQLLDRSENITDEAALMDIYSDELLRHTTQAILDVLYRTKFHRNSRIVADTLAVSKILLGFGHDVGERITEELKRQMNLQGGEDIDSSSFNPEPYSGAIPSATELDDISKTEGFAHVEIVGEDSQTTAVESDTLPQPPRIRRRKGEKVDEDATA